MENELDTTDPFLQLLTDALRAGPGSAEWHQAVARINAGEKGDTDEYAMLVRARENLASGKSYREVKAGVGFTRKLMQSVSADSEAGKKNWVSASWISYLGAGLIVGVVALAIFSATQAGTSDSEELNNLIFGSTRMAASLDSPLSAEWKSFGPLALDSANGLALTAPVTGKDVTGGGVVSTNGINPNEPFAVEATFQFQHISDDVIPQLFVTDDPSFSSDRGTSPHELVWLVSGGAQHVALPDNQLTDTSKKVFENQSIQVRIIVGQTHASVKCDGTDLWNGPSQLSNKPRYVGVRLLCRKPIKKDDKTIVTVKQLRVMTK